VKTAATVESFSFLFFSLIISQEEEKKKI